MKFRAPSPQRARTAAPSTTSETGRPKALIVLSSADILPLSEPANHPGIATGFFWSSWPL